MPELNSSRLGFGCAHLPAPLSRKEALALIETALDAGISHFDTARMYHWGEGEALLGAVARRRRKDMVIVTKAGLGPANRFAYAASRLTGGLPLPYATPRPGRFSALQVRSSVEQSLRALRTDRIDALLLHEIGLENVSDELKTELQRLQAGGFVGVIGVATSLGDTSDMIRLHPDLCGVVQVDHHWLRRPLRPLPAGATLIVHSVLRRQRTDADLDAHAVLKDTIARNINGVTLFSSSRAEHVIKNAGLIGVSGDGDTQLQTPLRSEYNPLGSRS